MKVSTLKTQLQTAAGGTFSLAATALDITGVKDLIEKCCGGSLAIANSKPDLQNLLVEGSGTVDSLKDRPVRVWFSTDPAGDNVTGILIAVQASGWAISTSVLTFEGGYLQQYSAFTSLALALSARPEDETDKTYGLGVGVYVSVDSKPLFLHACLPENQRTAQTADITLRGYFKGISLGDLNKLQGFISGYQFVGLLPSSIPLASEFNLRSAWYVINPTLKFMTAVGVEVRSARPCVLVGDRFEFDYLDVSFMMNAPGASTTVYWNVSADMKIGSSIDVLAAFDSDLNLRAELIKPVPIQPLLNQYLPAADLDFTVDALRIGLAFADKPFNWSVDLDVETPWKLLDAVAVEDIRLSINGQGTSPDDVKIDANLALGDAQFFLGGEMDKGAGWDFNGRMTHDYNVVLVPDPNFKPDGSGAPLKQEHVANNASHFFEHISDKLFPGSTSGVPPMLDDVDIKTLGVQFNTQTKDFHFDADLEFGHAQEVETQLTFANLHQEGSKPPTFEKRATGVITVFPGKPNEFAFDLGIDLKPDSKHFVALYTNTTDQALQLSDLVRAMFPDAGAMPGIPDFSITLKDAIVGYASEKQKTKTVSQSVFALDMGASLDLTSLGDIPLVGRSLSAAKTLRLAFQLIYPVLPADTKSFAKADLRALNDLITVAGPKFPADQDLSDLSVKIELRLGDGDPIEFKLPVTVNKSTGKLESSGGSFDPPAGSQATDDGVKWLQLNKQFGPVHLERAGFKFDSGVVTALLDGGLTALGLEVDLMGLSVSSKITDVEAGEFEPHFGLDGLGLRFSKGGVSFAGALLHLQRKEGNKTVDEYDGLASVQAEQLRLAAIGSLTEINGQTSLFLYAVLDYPLGGTPFFYVTGLAGGFGLNQRLIMPPVDKVADSPLIAAAKKPPAMPTDPGAAGPFITAQMQALETALTPSLGQYFGCAGVHFTSFELLDSFVLVSISFGREFELDLLGLSTLVVPPQLPQGEPALAQVTLQIVASFIPSQGLAIVQGRLTADSHILDPSCHLTGGFAIATWFGPNPNAGDFVVTLGGYHPDFQKPAHYPTVPRVGINWQISSELTVTGGLYFALTPRALMAGGAMRAVFQTSLDLTIATVDVKAWFIIGADFIVYWKPFHYSAHLYIDIGIDVVIHFLGTHDIGLDAAADLQVWGPAFGGRAHVTVTVIGIRIGFDVAFGATAPTPPPLLWDDTDAAKSFRKSFLPADDKIVSVAIAEGLVRKIAVAANDVWHVINARDFCVRTSSVIPIKQCLSAIPAAQQQEVAALAANTTFGIASMDKGHAQVQTLHQISVQGDGQSIEAQLVARPILQHVPGGLWAEGNSQDVNAKLLIEDAIVGYEIGPATPSVSSHTQPIKRDLLELAPPTPVDKAYVDSAITTFTATVPNPGDDPVANSALWDRIQGEIHRNVTRDAMLAALGFAGTHLDIGERFSADGSYAPSYGSLSR